MSHPGIDVTGDELFDVKSKFIIDLAVDDLALEQRSQSEPQSPWYRGIP